MRTPNKLAARTLAGAVCLAAGAGWVAGPAAGATPGQPTPAQIRAAVATATHSKLLWATINTCDDHGDGTVGIRGEMPALSFPTHLLMVASVEERSSTRHRYVRVSGSWKLGGQVFSRGAVVQEGLKLRFGAAVTLVARIDFEWFADGKRLGAITRTTTAGHRDAHGLPSGYSAASCTIR